MLKPCLFTHYPSNKSVLLISASETFWNASIPCMLDKNFKTIFQFFIQDKTLSIWNSKMNRKSYLFNPKMILKTQITGQYSRLQNKKNIRPRHQKNLIHKPYNSNLSPIPHYIFVFLKTSLLLATYNHCLDISAQTFSEPVETTQCGTYNYCKSFNTRNIQI